MTEFTPTVMNSPAEVAEAVRMPLARDADKVFEILSETDSVLLRFDTPWWGNEAFGVWGEWFVVQPDGTSDGGALFVSEGIEAHDPIRKLRSHDSILSSKGGLTSQAARRERHKAFNWTDSRRKLGPGMGPTDERDSFEDASCPLSVIEMAIRAPEADDDLLFVPGEGETEGRLSDADVVVTGAYHTQYGPKLAIEGDTYDVLSSGGENVADDVEWDVAHLAWTDEAGAWTCDPSGVMAVVEAVTDAGYTVGVATEAREHVEAAQPDEADTDARIESFGADG